MKKQPPCCGRIASQLHRAEGELATLAKRAAYVAQRGRDITKYKQQIAEAKEAVANYKQRQIDHEAEHAEEYANAI
jgi:hypothetical protein